MAIKALKRLSPSQLDSLVRAGKPVYVINTSALPSGDKGMIVINFFDGNRRDFFKMPPTFIPLSISDSIPSSKLIESRDFKQSLLKGMLTLVDPDSAEDYLATEDAQEEYESLVLSEHSAQAQNINVGAEVAKRTRTAHVANEGGGPIQDVSAVDTVSNKVRGLVESMVSGEVEAKDVITQLRRHQSALEPVDFSYVISNSTDAALTRFAKKALSKATAFADEEEEEEIVVRKKPKARKRAAKKRDDEPAFDLDDNGKDLEMNEDERRADEVARAKAMSDQQPQMRSKIQDEINDIMKGV